MLPNANPRNVVARFNMWAMSNLSPHDTGVKGCLIWCSIGEFEGKAIKHGPRIKVMLGQKITSEGLADAVSVTLDPVPRVIGALSGRVKKQVLQFVELNRETLLQYWNGQLTTRQMLDGLQPI